MAGVASELRRIGKSGQARLKTNLAAFNAEVSAFANKRLPREFVLFHKKLILLALRGIVLKTPVDTGRARGNWQVSIGSPASGVVDGTDRGGSSTISSGLGAVAVLRPFTVVWIANNLPYAMSLEGGWSGQAPVGMVAVTIAELQTMFR